MCVCVCEREREREREREIEQLGQNKGDLFMLRALPRLFILFVLLISMCSATSRGKLASVLPYLSEYSIRYAYSTLDFTYVAFRILNNLLFIQLFVHDLFFC